MLSSKDGLFDRARGRIVGSEHYLTKPFTKDELLSCDRHRTSGGDESMPLILIVDDSPTEVHVMQKALEKHGFQDRRGQDGAEGVRLGREMHPDLIFMDIVMPGMNGYQATRTLTNDPDHQRDPDRHGDLQGQETDKIWGLRQGAVDYMVKPVSPCLISSAKAQSTLAAPEARGQRALPSHD
jgi:twitching motility two-component system response regulator PilH